MRFRSPLLFAAVVAMLAGAAIVPVDARSLRETLVGAATEAPPVSGAFAAGANYSVCFTPGQNCEGMLVAEINQSRSSILVQAYSFTSPAIAQALVAAKGRGVDVRAILDKSQKTERYSGATFLKNAGIPVVIDEKPAIAHNKVMVFDQTSIGTGSFNFTTSAQQRNAENYMIIRGDSNLVKSYTDNWASRWRVSVPY